jgi:hypothetical protein
LRFILANLSKKQEDLRIILEEQSTNNLPKHFWIVLSNLGRDIGNYLGYE